LIRRRSDALFVCCLAALSAISPGCRSTATSSPTAVRLVDLYNAEQLHAASTSASATGRPIPRTEWRFDGPAPSPAPARLAATRGWEAGPGLKNLALRDARLTGTSTDDFPLIHFERTSGLEDHDQIYALELRMRASAGTTVSASFEHDEKIDLAAVVDDGRQFPWLTASTIQPGAQLRTYVLQRKRGLPMSAARHILIRPTNVAGATFEIESVRIVTRREHLAGIPSGIAWQGLSEIYRETLVERAAETIALPVTLPRHPYLDLQVGTVDSPPVTFSVTVARAGAQPQVVLTRTVTTPYRWETAPIDLSAFAGQKVDLTLSLSSPDAGSLGLWGSPVVRDRLAGSGAAPGATPGVPQGVILIWTDTLRRDHLDMYGYKRETAPVLHRLAKDGVLFTDCVSQATWTKVSTPSLFTSLYPTTHTVAKFTDRLPSSARTLAEVYRDAGYATLSLSSILFTGAFSNMHQGFEEVHESSSLSDINSSKTAREYVDRLLPWLEAHRDVPFFVFLHVSDPHDPYRPNPPYDTLWADPSKREEHEKQAIGVKKFIADPLMKVFGMPARDELVKAGIDPDAYVDADRDLYDGSIRGMDAEIGRLIERLRALKLDGRTLVVAAGDHGEEFLEHGRTFHGQTVYGELTNVPLMMWGPGLVPSGVTVERTVRIIDVMPTLLEISGLNAPEGIQGRSLKPVMAPGSRAGGVSAAAPDEDAPRPGVSEKAITLGDIGGAPPPHGTESFSMVLDGWKLIHNTQRAEGHPEYELFDVRVDPLNKSDVSARHPDVVEKLAARLKEWHAQAEASRLKPDSETAGSLSGEELERLRSLGYIQ
jgi:arylsulfatase A-like enzyme